MARRRKKKGRPGHARQQPDGRPPQPSVEPAALPRGWQWTALLLAAAAFVAYVPSLQNDFINWDDNKYVTENPHIQQGLSAHTIGWALTSFDHSNWHPLTWLSHAADVEVYGQAAWGHHLTNMFLHAASTALLFFVLSRLTRQVWPSILVAALFALHPLHVESVTWIAERKDVLSTFFMFLTVWAYTAYLERPTQRRYALILLAFAAALLSKPMAVTLPFVLLVFDAWPLRRLSRAAVVEKIPLFVMSAVSCVVTYLAQSGGGATRDWETLDFGTRVVHAVYAYVMYLARTFWPAPGTLVPYVPLPDRGGPTVQPWLVACCLAGLTALTALAIWQRRRRPYLLAGWLIYLGMLVPVIGLVQVGKQIMADRYTYVPLVGIFVAVAWLLAGIPRSALRRAAAVASAVTVVVLAVLTWQQQRVWQDSFTFWNNVIAHYPRSSIAHNQLGNLYSDRGDVANAAECYRKAVDAAYDNSEPGRVVGDYMAHTNLANKLKQLRQYDEARKHYEIALQLAPDYAWAHNGLGAVLFETGDIPGAINHLERSIELDPNYWPSRENLAVVLLTAGDAGKVDEAIRHLQAAISLKPDRPTLYRRMAEALTRKGDTEASRQFQERADQLTAGARRAAPDEP